jgi:hypothetical protein
MSWRGKYIGWYKLLYRILEYLVPDLSDREIMENVTPEDEIIIPIGQENLPTNKSKPIPNLSIKLNESEIEIGILYYNQAQIDLLKNILKDTHASMLELLLNSFQKLDPNYETVLYSITRDEKPTLVRKYVTARVDKDLLDRTIEEAEYTSKGGRQIIYNKSVYIPPKSIKLYLTRVKTALDDKEFTNSLTVIKPIYEILTGIKTQREIISDRLSKPRKKRNMYREFIEALNEVRRRKLISAERRREINNMWREDDESNRESIMEYLNELLSQDKVEETSS